MHFHIAGRPFHELGMHETIAKFILRVLKGRRQTSQIIFTVKALFLGTFLSRIDFVLRGLKFYIVQD